MKQILLFFVTLIFSVASVHAQVQIDKQIHLNGATADDRRVTGLDKSIDSSDAVNANSIMHNALIYAVATGGGNSFNVTLPIDPVTYKAGLIVTFKSNQSITGPVLLNVNNHGSIAVMKNLDAQLEFGDIKNGQVVSVIFDGTQFQVISQLSQATDFTGSLAGEVVGNQKSTVIVDGAISNNKIAAGAVTDDKITSVDYAKVTGSPLTLPPSGPAGGDLAGTYPNPAVANNAVTSVKILDGTIATADIANAAITNAKLAANSVASANITDGTIVANDLASNAVTTVKIADGNITNAKMATGSVNSANVIDGALVNADINAAAAIAYSKLALTNSIVTNDLTDASVTTAKIADANVTTAKLADSAVTSIKIKTGAVQTGHLADGAVTNAKVTDVAYSKITGTPSSLPPSGAAGGDLTGIYPNPTVANSSITSAKILDGTVTNADISTTAAIAYSKLALTNSITNSDLTANSVTTSKVVDGTVTTAKMADSAITGLKVISNTIGPKHINTTGATSGQVLSYNGTGAAWTTPSGAPSGAAGGSLSGTYPNPTIASGAITNTEVSGTAAIAYSKLALTNSIQNSDIVANAITTSKVANGTVTTSKMADSAISGLKLLTGAVGPKHISTIGAGAGQAMVFDGTNVVWAAAGGAPTGAAGGSLSGTYPNPTIASGAITNTEVSGTAAIAYSKLALTNSIQNSDIVANAITTSKVANGTVTTSKLADSAVSSLKLLTAAVGTVHIQNGSVTIPKLSASGTADATTFLRGDGSWSAPSGGAPSGSAGGSLTGTYPNPTIASGAITNTEVSAAAAIAYSKLNLTNSIGNIDIVANAITTSKVANGTVTTSKMADSAISGLKLLTGAVGPKHISTIGAASGQVIGFNGTNVVWTTPAGGGTQYYANAANTGGSVIAVVLGGTDIPLPNSQLLNGFIANGSNTFFTVSNAGVYRISYDIRLSSSLLVSTRVNLNGTGVTALTMTPSQAQSRFHAEALVALTAGDILELQLFGLLGAATLDGGAGANLVISKVN